MNKIKETLWADYSKVSKQIESLEIKDDNYELLLEERDKIRNELIKFEQADMEAKHKQGQLEAENKREKIRNQITIGTFVVSTGVSVWAILRTFRFDETATITSTMGRGILNGVIPKMFKK